MTHTAICQLTAGGRDTARANDLRFRIRKLSEQAHAAPAGSLERARLRAIGVRLIAELKGEK